MPSEIRISLLSPFCRALLAAGVDAQRESNFLQRQRLPEHRVEYVPAEAEVAGVLSSFFCAVCFEKDSRLLLSRERDRRDCLDSFHCIVLNAPGLLSSPLC